MKQILNGYKEYYFIDETGKVYNKNTKKYLKEDSKHRFTLKTEEDIYKKVTLKELYKAAYGLNYCEDDIQDLIDEEWKYIEDTEENYLISNKGRVKSKCGYKARILKANITNNGYLRVDIVYNKQRQSKLVHRLVAAAFLVQPKSIDEQLHHIDFNKKNNAATNLEWLKPLEHAKRHNNRKDI